MSDSRTRRRRGGASRATFAIVIGRADPGDCWIAPGRSTGTDTSGRRSLWRSRRRPEAIGTPRRPRRDSLGAEPIERCRLIRLALRRSGHRGRSVDDYRTARRRSRWNGTGRWRNHRRRGTYGRERRHESCDAPLPCLQRQHRCPPSVPVPPEPRGDPKHAVQLRSTTTAGMRRAVVSLLPV